jgi:excisionase family DNA binding protein
MSLSDITPDARAILQQARHEEWLTIRQVALVLQVSEDTVMREIQRGHLDARKVGRQWRIHKVAVCYRKPTPAESRA